MILVGVCLLLIGFLLWWKIRDYSKYSEYPPGPTRLPLVGNLFQIALQCTTYPPRIFQKLAGKYGDVMFIKMGMLDIVMISSHEAALEVFQSDAALDRHLVPSLQDRNMGGNYGLTLASGDVWQTARRFTIRTLRDFGFGKSASMDDAINEEYEKFEKHFRTLIKKGDGKVHIENIFDLPVLNEVWRLVTGKSYELDDTRINTLLRLSHDFVRSTNMTDISVAYPVVRRWFPGLSGTNLQNLCVDKLKDFVKNLILEHKESGAYKNPECFIDVFLAKIEEDKRTGEVSHFNYDQFVYLLLDLFQASSETTSGVLGFILLHMIRNPEIQEKVRKEVNSVLSPESRVTAELKSKLPYTTATILETLRYSNVASFSVPREATRDVSICGHKIKKGTPLMVNFEAVHMQKSIWGDPEVYRPDRFLTSDGTHLNSKIDYVMTFTAGKRACLGQSLAETTALIYLVNLVRHFELKKVANQPTPPAEPKVGLTNVPQPFDIFVVERN